MAGIITKELSNFVPTPPSLKRLLFLFITAFCSLFFSTTSSSDTLRVGTTLWPGYEPLYLAEEIKAFETNNIRMIHYPSTSSVLRAFKHKVLEAAALTLDEVVFLSESNIPVDIILVLDISEGADVIIGRPELKGMQGLIGTTVAVESTAVGAYVLSRALEVHNIDISQISLVNVEKNGHKVAYEQRLADAVVTFEPVRTQLLNQGAIELFTSAEIPGEIVDVLVVHKGVLNSHEDALYDLTQGWFKALKYMQTNPQESFAFISTRMKITPQDVKESYIGLNLPSLERNKLMLSAKQGGEQSGDNKFSLQHTLNKLTEHMKHSGLIISGNPENTSLNTSFLP